MPDPSRFLRKNGRTSPGRLELSPKIAVVKLGQAGLFLGGSGLEGARKMIAVAFSTMAILALVSILAHWMMRIRLMRLDSSKDRIEWLSFRTGDDVLNTYQALFPESVLPRFYRLLFWAVIIVAAVLLFASLILKV